jgi:hypothetical protein
MRTSAPVTTHSRSFIRTEEKRVNSTFNRSGGILATGDKYLKYLSPISSIYHKNLQDTLVAAFIRQVLHQKKSSPRIIQRIFIEGHNSDIR